MKRVLPVRCLGLLALVLLLIKRHGLGNPPDSKMPIGSQPTATSSPEQADDERSAKPAKSGRERIETDIQTRGRHHLESIIIPRVTFEDTSLEEAIEYLRVRSIELDPDPSYLDRHGISLIIRKPGEGPAPTENAPPRDPTDEPAPLGSQGDPAAPRLTLQLENVSLWSVLVEIGKQTGLTVEFAEKNQE